MNGAHLEEEEEEEEEERPRNSWMQEVTTGMRGKEINNREWIGRENKEKCKRNVEKCENIDTLYISKKQLQLSWRNQVTDFM